MKKFLSYLVIATSLCLALVACQKAPYLTMDGPNNFSIKGTGGTETITFSCNKAWSVTSSEKWLKISPEKGYGSDGVAKVSITCEPNPTYDPRTAMVTITTEGLSETIKVTQSQAEGFVTSKTSYEISKDGGDIEVKFQTNVTVDVTIPDAAKSWISVKSNSTKALTENNIVLTVAKNETMSNRNAEIVLKGGNSQETISISQAQKDGVEVDKDKVSLDDQSGDFTIVVYSNVAYTVEKPSWVTEISSNTEEGNPLKTTYVYSVSAYDVERTGNIVYKWNDGVNEQTTMVVVEQNKFSWTSIGTGLFYEGFWEKFFSECEVLKADGHERYRFINPYGPSKLSVMKPEYVEIWRINDDGNIKWKTYNTGFEYDSGLYIMAYWPSELLKSYASMESESRFRDDQIIDAYPYFYIDGLGGFGCNHIYYCLPGRTMESFQTWLKKEGVI